MLFIDCCRLPMINFYETIILIIYIQIGLFNRFSNNHKTTGRLLKIE